MQKKRRWPGETARLEAQMRMLYSQTERIALRVIENKARKILREHPNLDEFVMGMGTWQFTRKGKNDAAERHHAYLEPISRFFNEWDDCLKLTGSSIRFTATGPLVTDW